MYGGGLVIIVPTEIIIVIRVNTKTSTLLLITKFAQFLARASIIFNPLIINLISGTFTGGINISVGVTREKYLF